MLHHHGAESYKVDAEKRSVEVLNKIGKISSARSLTSVTSSETLG